MLTRRAPARPLPRMRARPIPLSRPRGQGRETFVTERDQPVGDEAMKFGLLMESAQAHQKLAETHLTKLLAHTQGLDDVVRDEIRRTLIEEFQALSAESDRVTAAMLTKAGGKCAGGRMELRVSIAVHGHSRSDRTLCVAVEIGDRRASCATRCARVQPGGT